MGRFVHGKRHCEREYENGDAKPDPSPDILFNGDFHGCTLTIPARIDLSTRSIKKVAWLRRKGRPVKNTRVVLDKRITAEVSP